RRCRRPDPGRCGNPPGRRRRATPSTTEVCQHPSDSKEVLSSAQESVQIARGAVPIGLRPPAPRLFRQPFPQRLRRTGPAPERPIPAATLRRPSMPLPFSPKLRLAPLWPAAVALLVAAGLALLLLPASLARGAATELEATTRLLAA